MRPSAVFLIFLLLLFPWVGEAKRAKEMVNADLAECESAQGRYFAELGLKSTCNGAFHHHQPLRFEAAPAPAGFKIAQFNVYRLGEESSRFKNHKLVAKIMNQWDIVGAVELTPAKATERTHNDNLERALEKALAKGDATAVATIRKSFEPPGYFRLLADLRELDPSWSLIMSAEPRSDGKDSGETVGIFYRASVLTAIPTAYCVRLSGIQEAPGCMVKFDEETDPLISRPPFLASFRFREKTFTFMTAHLRFTATPEESQKMLKIFPGECGISCTTTKDVQPRIAEATASVEVMAELQEKENRPVIFGGDFNFSASQARVNGLRFMMRKLSGGRLLNDKPTTLSTTAAGAVSSYDHFIVDRRGLELCDASSVEVFDFRDESLMPELAGYRIDPDRVLNAYKTYWESQVTTKGRKFKSWWTSAEIDKAVDSFNRQIKTPETPNAFYRAILSDHFPISMNCR